MFAHFIYFNVVVADVSSISVCLCLDWTLCSIPCTNSADTREEGDFLQMLWEPGCSGPKASAIAYGDGTCSAQQLSVTQHIVTECFGALIMFDKISRHWCIFFFYFSWLIKKEFPAIWCSFGEFFLFYFEQKWKISLKKNEKILLCILPVILLFFFMQTCLRCILINSWPRPLPHSTEPSRNI